MSVGCENVIASWTSVCKPRFQLVEIKYFAFMLRHLKNRFCCWLFCSFWLSSTRSCSVRTSLLSKVISVSEAYIGPQDFLVTFTFAHTYWGDKFSFSLLVSFGSYYLGSHLFAGILGQDVCTTDKQVKVLAFKVFSVGAAQPPLPKLGMLSTSQR